MIQIEEITLNVLIVRKSRQLVENIVDSALKFVVYGINKILIWWTKKRN